ncbi:autotransporter-associated beta strand repeat-containing protein [Sphingomonas mali]|uniref:autotransporter-associated beta strand repeat-containing protein n=1 Tax=Sphingomonas mali TaxID=40682 RepID=UPI000AAA0CD7|nr:autotransporter-associated beta strand repeat-containing protein [Sphingomonas mali]
MAYEKSTAGRAGKLVAPARCRLGRRALGRMLLAGSALGCSLLPTAHAAAQAVRETSNDGSPIVIDSGAITVPNGGGIGILASTSGQITINSDSVFTESALGHGIEAQGGSASVKIDSGTVETRGAGASGILATTSGGGVHIISGNVHTTGTGQVFGISAVTNGGGIVIDSGTINVVATGADNGRGIHANSGGGDIIIHAGTTLGYTRGIFTTTLFSGPELGFTAGNTLITSESAAATGGNAIIGQGYSVDLTSGRAEGTANIGFTAATLYVSAGAGGASVKADETIGHGYGQYGIQVLATGDLVIDSNSVVTDGAFGNGITAAGAAAITVDSGTIATAGQNSTGILVDGYTAYTAEPVKVTSDAITTAGNNSNGIFVVSFDGTSGMTGDTAIDSGTIVTGGSLSHGIVVGGSADPGYQFRAPSPTAGTGTLTVNSDSIVASGAGARGIVFDHAGAIALTSGAIDAQAGGIYMWAGSTVDITSDTLYTRGGPGIVVYGQDGDVRIDAGSTEVGADGDVGIYVETTSGDVSITADRTTTNGIQPASGFTADGISGVSSQGGNVSIDSGIVSVKGNAAFGIYGSTTGTVGITSDQVATSGLQGTAIWAGGSAGVTVDSGSIVTSGNDALGIRARSANGDVSIASASIQTSGNGATGIFVPTSVGGGAIMTGDITIHSGTIQTSGTNASGIVVANVASPAYGLRDAQGGTGALSITSDTITTSGAGSWGIAVDHSGPIAIESGAITSGESGGGAGIYVWAGDTVDISSGSVTTPNGPGIVVYGGAGDVTIGSGKALVGAGGDVGVFARTTTGDIVITAGTTTTTRLDILNGQFTADGVTGISAAGGNVSIAADVTSVAGTSAWGVTASTSAAAAITSNKVTTAGTDGVAIFGRGDTGGVTIVSGDVTTSGARGHGIQAVATTGGISVDSKGTISVAGSGSAGVHARSGSGAIDVALNAVTATGGGANSVDLASSGGGDIALDVNGAVSVVGTGQFAATQLNGSGNLVVNVGAAGSLTGSGSGLVAQRGALVLDNAGTIRGNGTRASLSAVPEAGVRVQSSAVIRNSGTISGHDYGIVTTQLGTPNPAGGTSFTWFSADTQLINSGTIRGDNDDAVALYGGGTVRNSGRIEGGAGATADGIQMQWYPGADSGRAQIGTIVNETGGQISGARYGILLAGGGTIDNAGTIEGGTTGVVLVSQNFAGKTGNLTNGGTIRSRDGTGVLLDLTSATVVNSGRIDAGNLGVDAKGDLSLTNSGVIVSAGHAVQSANALQLDNSGSLTSNGGSAIVAGQGGTIVNRGTILGAGTAITAGGATLLDNAGRIESVSGLAVSLSGADDRLVLRTGSSIEGTVDGGAGRDGVALIGSSNQAVAGQTIGRLDNFETLAATSGFWSTSGYVGAFESVTIAADAALQVNEVPDSGGDSAIVTQNVRNDGLLVLNFGSDVLIDDENPLAVTGTGALLLSGAGTVGIDTDTITHTGGTIVANGALQLTGSMAGDIRTIGNGVFVLGDGGTSGSFTGDLVNDGTFVYARSDSYSFVGDFSGSGLLEKRGAGVLTFEGGYKFVGTTSILGGSVKFTGQIDPTTEFDLAGGTLDLGGTDQKIGGLSGSAQSGINLEGSRLTINQDENSVFAGTITGSGGLTLTGGGQLNLTGNSTYTGTTTIEDGTLKVNGAIVSSVLLGSGGTLGGNGRVGSTTVNGGRVGPGNSIGRLTVSGDLAFGAGAVYEVEANAAGAADRIDVTGATSIASTATVQVLAENGNYNPRTDYTILTSAGGISGTFGSVTSNLAFLTPRLRYAPNAITLSLYRNDVQFAAVAETSNQGAVADAVQSLGIGNTVYEGVLVQSAAMARRSYDSLSGEIYATTSAALTNDAHLVRDALLASAPGEDAAGIFPIASATASWGSVDATRGAAGADLDNKGLVVGAGYAGQGISFGLAGTIFKSDQDVDARASNASAESWGLAGVLGYAKGGLKAQVGATVAWHRVHTRRTVDFGAGATTQRGLYDASTRQFYGSLSYDLVDGPLDLAPFVRLANVRVHSDAFAETGSAAALSIGEADQQSTFLTLGADARLPLGSSVGLKASAGWQHGWGDLAATLDNRLAGGASAFRIVGARLPKDAAVLNLGFEADVGPVRLGASYVGRFGSHWQDHGARATVSIRF